MVILRCPRASVSAEMAAMAHPLSRDLSSRTSSCDYGSISGKQKLKDVLSHLHHVLFVKASKSTA